MSAASSSTTLLGDAPGGFGPPQTLREALWSLRQQQRRGPSSQTKGPTDTAHLIQTVVLDRPPPPPRIRTQQQQRELIPQNKRVRQQPASKAQEGDEPPAAEPKLNDETTPSEPRSDVVEVASSSSSSSRDEVGEAADLERLKRQRLSLEEEVEAAATAAASAKWRVSLHDLRGVYLHGLRKVGALQSLRDAPDAILPGNFPEPPLETRNPSS